MNYTERDRYYKQCPTCKGDIETNLQGTPINPHDCYIEIAEKEIREENCRDITTLPMYQTERYWRAEKLGWAMQMAIAERSEVLRLRDELEKAKRLADTRLRHITYLEKRLEIIYAKQPKKGE